MESAFRRVAIVGCAGSGKSTVARDLAARTGLPLFHLDALHWQPGWQEPSRDEWRETVASLVENDRWIIDGNYNGTMEVRLAAADAVVFIDLPRRVCMWRVLKRRWMFRNRPRPDMGEGCRERLTLSFLRWVWGYPKTGRPKVLSLLRDKPEGQVFVLRDSYDVDHFLALAGAPATVAR